MPLRAHNSSVRAFHWPYSLAQLKCVHGDTLPLPMYAQSLLAIVKYYTHDNTTSDYHNG